MKKVGLGIAVVVAAVVAITHLPALLLLVGLVAGAYWAFTRYMEASSGGRKIAWFSMGTLFSVCAIFNVPGLIALVAGGFIYYVVRKRRNGISMMKRREPFHLFEREWKKIITK